MPILQEILTDHRKSTEGLYQANGGGMAKVKGHTEWVCTDPNSRNINRAHDQSATPESQAQLEPFSLDHLYSLGSLVLTAYFQLE